MLFQQIARGELLCPFILKLPVASGVFAEGGQDHITGKEAVGGGVAAADGLAVFGFGSAVVRCALVGCAVRRRHDRVPVPLSQSKTYVY